ncbi:ABC transporter ATP-binding protein [Desulforhopalus singaporensis]|uniref:Amino acid/amide ABC transporter ATP-binding protein 2, HAAT family (TC 3.A.1.4.-) n=1 Tax=Desulforhopalus singaporensis TaxID=91360 RepID=A0A1H0UEJ0_9BACT|nr:ABC transporter ATP-binding protein [Desulforhopalus singaporensis]SDP64408.1 amino acid/amide ABC transporter ATP-binding protein 2, HAAT family (TC 3.A.1.4.-) [Desulforhopalus singaporensis]
MMLKISNFCCGYGNMQVVNHLDLEVKKGSVTGILGANGAGKSSLIMAIAGHVEIKNGSIVYNGEDITSCTPMERVSRGIALVPEGRRLFKSMSVYENLIIGGYITRKKDSQTNMEKVFDIFPILGERIRQNAGSLSGGEQQMLAIGRALMTDPKVLMVDELSLGLMPKAIDICYEVIEKLNSLDMTIMLVEQSTKRALQASDNVIVFESGNTVWKGSSNEAKKSSEIIDSMLGLRNH